MIYYVVEATLCAEGVAYTCHPGGYGPRIRVIDSDTGPLRAESLEPDPVLSDEHAAAALEAVRLRRTVPEAG